MDVLFDGADKSMRSVNMWENAVLDGDRVILPVQRDDLQYAIGERMANNYTVHKHFGAQGDTSREIFDNAVKNLYKKGYQDIEDPAERMAMLRGLKDGVFLETLREYGNELDVMDFLLEVKKPPTSELVTTKVEGFNYLYKAESGPSEIFYDHVPGENVADLKIPETKLAERKKGAGRKLMDETGKNNKTGKQGR
jgi:hypothetical protein